MRIDRRRALDVLVDMQRSIASLPAFSRVLVDGESVVRTIIRGKSLGRGPAERLRALREMDALVRTTFHTFTRMIAVARHTLNYQVLRPATAESESANDVDSR